MKFPRFLLMGMALLSALWLGAAQALPNVDEVQAATQRGDYAGAEKMMREVLAAKPDSARAHYVLAEILAHERKFGEAREHASRARTLDPAVKFADPATFSAFEQLLQRQHAAATSAVVPGNTGQAAPPPRAAPVERSESSGGVPVWLLIGGVVVFIALAMRWMRNRAAPVAQPAYAGGAAGAGYGTGPGGYGYGPGVPPAPGSGGPGLMGVGLAAAGGVAAGMLAERMLHGDRDERSLPRDGGGSAGGGGLLPGSFDSDAGSAADELSRRSIDFGSGDGWDSGGSGGGDFSGGGGGGGDDW